MEKEAVAPLFNRNASLNLAIPSLASFMYPIHKALSLAGTPK